MRHRDDDLVCVNPAERFLCAQLARVEAENATLRAEVARLTASTTPMREELGRLRRAFHNTARERRDRKIVRWYQDGIPAKAIAKSLKLSRTYVYKTLHRRNVDIRGRGRPRKPSPEPQRIGA